MGMKASLDLASSTPASSRSMQNVPVFGLGSNACRICTQDPHRRRSPEQSLERVVFSPSFNSMMAVCSAPVGLASLGLVSGLGSALFRASDPRFAKLLLTDPRGKDCRSVELNGQIAESDSTNCRGIAGTWGSEASPDVLLAVVAFWILTIPQRPLPAMLRPCSWKVRDRLGVIGGALEATRLRLNPSSDSRETREPSPSPAGGIIGRDIMSGFHRRHCVSLPPLNLRRWHRRIWSFFVFLFSSE
ncbi:hypothetical protein U1Q18_014361 [Sarracenia purpurea var. burkii]